MTGSGNLLPGLSDSTEINDLATAAQVLVATNHNNDKINNTRNNKDINKNTTTLPRIKIIGTGGTIASKGNTSSSTAGYKIGLTLKDMLGAIPDISNICTIEFEQICNVDSKNINEVQLLLIYKCLINSLQSYDGIVVTHGTDTLSETAFFIESAIDAGEVPIVMVGSMRPSTSISADGPMNLYQAICIASDPKSKGRSVLVSLNDQISSGYYITKTNANSLDSFNVRQGYLGNFVNNEIHYYYPPTKPQGCHKFKLNWDQLLNSGNLAYGKDDTLAIDGKKVVKLPNICIIYGYQTMESLNLFDFINDSFDGLIMATMGAGSLPDIVNEKLLTLKIPVVFSKRSMDGMIPKANLPIKTDSSDTIDHGNIISSGYLNPEKSRILLQLCLHSNYSMIDIREVFKGVYGG